MKPRRYNIIKEKVSNINLDIICFISGSTTAQMELKLCFSCVLLLITRTTVADSDAISIADHEDAENTPGLHETKKIQYHQRKSIKH